jgi:hypothetical protein
MTTQQIEKISAIVMEGATFLEIEAESKRQAEMGNMCIVFPSSALMNHWLRRVAAPLG